MNIYFEKESLVAGAIDMIDIFIGFYNYVDQWFLKDQVRITFSSKFMFDFTLKIVKLGWNILIP